MLLEGCELNQIVYNAFIDGFYKVGKLNEAQEVFTKMLGYGYADMIRRGYIPQLSILVCLIKGLL